MTENVNNADVYFLVVPGPGIARNAGMIVAQNTAGAPPSAGGPAGRARSAAQMYVLSAAGRIM